VESHKRSVVKTILWRFLVTFTILYAWPVADGQEVPNIVDISYGRGVGYTFTQHDLGEEIHKISTTKIRAQLRAEGKL